MPVSLTVTSTQDFLAVALGLAGSAFSMIVAPMKLAAFGVGRSALSSDCSVPARCAASHSHSGSVAGRYWESVMALFRCDGARIDLSVPQKFTDIGGRLSYCNWPASASASRRRSSTWWLSSSTRKDRLQVFRRAG
jgi:hypothetical protein